MKIQIVGYGFVGQAHANALSALHEIHICDPVKNYNDCITDPDAVIICVSTPENKETGACNMSNVFDALCICPINVPVLIKSTISLEGWRELKASDKNDTISFSPEFLRAEHADEDFKNQNVIYVGGGNEMFWQSLLSVSLNKKTAVRNPESLILAKYFRNSFLAAKVSFFNQVYDLCEAAGVNFNVVRELVAADARIGESHSRVTSERGFGGHCFPKDTAAILNTGYYYGVELSNIYSAVTYNKTIRNEHDSWDNI